MTDHVIVIATPLEAQHVATIRAAAPAGVEVVYEPDLLPPTRYVADHRGVGTFVRSPRDQARWEASLARATILWDFPRRTVTGPIEIALAPGLQWIQTTSSGVGKAVHDLGLADSPLLITTARGVHAEPLAEFVFLVLLAHAKNLRQIEADQRAHRWERTCAGELAGQTLVAVGAGKVGAHVARVGRAFGMRTIGVLARPAPERAQELGLDRVAGQAELHAVLGLADAVVLATPHTPATEGLIDRAAIAAMKRGIVLVNIARGAVIDEAAMIAALRDGRIAYAGLDVAAVEPLPPDSPLWDMPNVMVSPHSASTAPSENAKIAAIFCANLPHFLAGRRDKLINVLDKRRMY